MYVRIIKCLNMEFSNSPAQAAACSFANEANGENN